MCELNALQATAGNDRFDGRVVQIENQRAFIQPWSRDSRRPVASRIMMSLYKTLVKPHVESLLQEG